MPGRWAADGRPLTLPAILVGMRALRLGRKAQAGVSQQESRLMSMHSSLKAATRIAVKRNVLKRYERIDAMRKKGKWKDGDRAYGLPKLKSS